MGINTIEFGGSDEKALEYIRQRGYCSYSSMCNVRDKKDPQPYVEMPYHIFGKELHSRFLERKKLVTLTPPEEIKLKKMVFNLSEDAMVVKLMEGATFEVEFDEKVNGLRMYGRIDILSFAIGDLKTTRIANMKQFVAAMDFLQVAIYRRVRKLKDAYYIGSCKEEPHHPMVFNATYYQERMRLADQQLDYYSRYIKRKL